MWIKNKNYEGGECPAPPYLLAYDGVDRSRHHRTRVLHMRISFEQSERFK
jgi:hypothetical protein